MSPPMFHTVEEYDRQRWTEDVLRALRSIVDAAEGDRTWFPVSELKTFSWWPSTEVLGGQPESVPTRPRPQAFVVDYSYTLNALTGTDRMVVDVAKKIVDKFMAETDWRYAQPRIQLAFALSCFRFRVWDEYCC